MDELLLNIRNCTHCAAKLPVPPRPVLQAATDAKIVIIGQAPGVKVHTSGIPWKDKSGDTLRNWLGVEDTIFYDASVFALIPMGFCFPGTGKSGDLPPRPECAPLWHKKLWAMMPNVQLTILVGRYAQAYYLNLAKSVNLTTTVSKYENYLSKGFFPLPHPSPRNRYWLKQNPWFEVDLLAILKHHVSLALSQ